MDYSNHKIVLAVFLVLITVLLYLGICYKIDVAQIRGPVLLRAADSGTLAAVKSSPNSTTSSPVVKSKTTGSSGSYDQMNEAEKVNAIINTYIEEPENKKEIQETADENSYINSMPRDSNCADNYMDCPKWASNSECVINPEFMLYNCKSSCESCKLNPQQLYNVSSIYNNREPPGCAYHGYSYPDPLAFRLDILNK